MKKLLLFVLGLVVVCMGCKEEDDQEQKWDWDIGLSAFWNLSKDSIHYYDTHGVNGETSLSKYEIVSRYNVGGGLAKFIWAKPFVSPNPFVLDLGYGNTKNYNYSVSSIMDTDENILVYWDNNVFSDYISFEEYLVHEIYIGKYTLSGDFIENIPIKVENTIFYGAGRIVEMYNGNYLLISSTVPVNTHDPWFRNRTYLTVDSSTGHLLEVFEEVSGEGLNLPNSSFNSTFIQFANNHIVAVYGDGTLKICDWDKKKQIGVDVESFINQKYPNEVHAPQYSTSHEVITETYADFTLRVIFYSGEKIEHRLRFNYETQEIIELML